MTPEERAEKILTELFYWRRSHGKPITNLKEAIAAQIREAESESIQICHTEECEKKTLDLINKARQEALEKAAKVAEEEWKKHPFPQISPSENAELTALRIRDAIRSLKKEKE